MPTISIDFGTTNSQIAYLDNNGRATLLRVDGQEKIPTLLYYEQELQRFYLGQTAWHLYEAANDRDLAEAAFLSHFKRTFCQGRITFDTPSTLKKDETSYFSWGEVLTEFFRFFKQKAEEYAFAGQPVTELKLTHPAEFLSCELLEQSAREAGFEEISLLIEPEAAYTGYQKEGGAELGNNILVFDMGGGTLDIINLRRQAENDAWYIPRAPLQINTAGRDIDEALADFLTHKIRENFPDYIPDEKLRAAVCTNIKERLGRGGLNNTIFRYRDDSQFDGLFTCDFTYLEFVQILNRLMQPCYETLQRFIGQLDEPPQTLLMVGGSCCINGIKEELQTLLPACTVYEPNRADDMVALGAAYHIIPLPEPEPTLKPKPPKPCPVIKKRSKKRSPTLLRSFSHGDNIFSVAFSPDGKHILTGADDHTAKLWDIDSGVIIHTFPHEGRVYSVAFNPNNRQALSGSSDKTVKLWDISSGTLIRTFLHKESVNDVAFSPSGKLALAGTNEHYIPSFLGILGAMVFPPSIPYQIRAMTKKSVRLWDIISGSNIRSFLHDAQVNAVCFSSDGKFILTGSRNKTATVWNLDSGSVIRKFSHSDSVTAVAFSPDGKLALSGSSDKSAKLWDINSGALVRKFSHAGQVTAVAFSPDGEFALTGALDKTAKLWNIASGTLIYDFSYEDWVHSVAFSPNGKLVLTGSSDKCAKLWDISCYYK